MLRNMRFSLRRLPSMAKQENFDKILHFFAKKYAWSIQRCRCERGSSNRMRMGAITCMDIICPMLCKSDLLKIFLFCMSFTGILKSDNV